MTQTPNPDSELLRDKYNLTKKESLAVVAYANSASTPTEAARCAQYGAPHVAATKIFQRPRVKSALADYLASKGVSEDLLASKLIELLGAQKDGGCNCPSKAASGACVRHDTPDNSTRARVLELAMKCLGWLQEHNVNVMNVNMSDGSDTLQEARKLLGRYDVALQGRVVGRDGG